MQVLHIPEAITTLGGAVRWARQRRGLSQDGLAQAARILSGQSTVSDIERGARTGLHPALAEALGVPLGELLSRPAGPHSQEIQARGRARLTAEEASARPTRQPRQCGLCRKSDHLTADCNLQHRRRNHFCRVCCGLAHRRDRGGCVCGGRYAPEVVTPPEPPAQSSAQLCVDAA